MRILFYSETCNFCLKLLEYIDRNKLGEFFKLICIDKTSNIPKNISVVPTIIAPGIEAPLEGKKAFEYVINQKYFNHPTNNVEYTKQGVPQPNIEEDSKANTSRSGTGFIYVDKDVERKFNEKEERNQFEQVFNFRQLPTSATNQQQQKNVQPPNIPHQAPPSDDKINELIKQRNIQDKKMQALLRLRGTM